MKRTPIHELLCQSIVKAEYVDHGAWFEIEITTNDGRFFASGGYKPDASAELQVGGQTVRKWPW